MKFYKYQGAGNDFLIADNRNGAIELSAAQIAAVCDRRYGVGADGLMLLESSDTYDFRMNYYNSDGSGGMMCGNGGRCMVAFAADMGITHYDFDAADGFHTAQILKDENGVKTVRLKMKDVSDVTFYKCLTGVTSPSDGWFLDTGTRHFVRIVSCLDSYDVTREGSDLRWNAEELKPAGANVNFIEPERGLLKVRTYEKGVEDETYACGTGIVASAIAAYLSDIVPSGIDDKNVFYDIKAVRDRLRVDFIPYGEMQARDVILTGHDAYVAGIFFC